ncbi:SKP1 ASK-interacting 16 isoform 1 [Olea europaea subsp. europaea]|nr:SKP1 ASK-interacting 16 isoform 1 [Olea europaea subsp. europaea]
MHCLNLKVVTDFNARSWPSRLVVDSYAAGTRRQILNCNSNYKHQNVRLVKIVACSTSEDPNPISGSCQGQNSVLSRTQTYALLKQQLEVAAKSEDYKEAARLRDSLKIFEEEEPVLRLKRLLKEAITEEKFEDAARYRDELKEIAPHSLLKCSSDATTLGVRVQVRSVYIESRSQPSKGLYFFAYRIRITNNSDRPVQLLRRHWIITDANGKTENVW